MASVWRLRGMATAVHGEACGTAGPRCAATAAAGWVRVNYVSGARAAGGYSYVSVLGARAAYPRCHPAALACARYAG